jgi:hypothetical protein
MRRWLVNGHAWADSLKSDAMVVCDATRFLRSIEEGRPPVRRRKRVECRQKGQCV